jgi:hypothetical protein
MSRAPWVTKGFPVSVRWSHKKGKQLWDQGMPLAEMASRLATSPSAIKNAAVRWGWTPRKKWRRQQTNWEHLTMPQLVTRRCEHCKGIWEGERNVAHPIHPECPAVRRAA